MQGKRKTGQVSLDKFAHILAGKSQKSRHVGNTNKVRRSFHQPRLRNGLFDVSQGSQYCGFGRCRLASEIQGQPAFLAKAHDGVIAARAITHNTVLTTLLLSDRALTHPMVVAELACGTPPAPRTQTLGDIGLLQPATQANLDAVRELIEREQLYGLGCGLIDVALLASTLITPNAQLWTFDKRLASLAL